MEDYNEGVFAGVMGALENLGYRGSDLETTLRNILSTTMNWTENAVNEAIEEVEWVFTD